MAEHDQTGPNLLLQALKTELDFFDAGGYGRPFRSEWRPTLLLRDSPACVNYNSREWQSSFPQCPFFSLDPRANRKALLPCHHIPLDAHGNTVAKLYQTGTQKELDERYRDWLSALTREIETS